MDLGLPVTWVPRAAGQLDVDVAGRLITELIAEHRADMVVDLSDEPVLDQRRRLQLASHALIAGAAYQGADFRFDPPARPVLASRPSIAVISTGKRTGKTAVSGELARQLETLGRRPVILAMGRGGPPEPIVVPAGTTIDAQTLLDVVERGGHAASDFYEDAVTTGAGTVGTRRCGGGLAGGVTHSNVEAGVAAAEQLPGDVLVLEGSGAAIPPVHADATVLVIPGHCDPEFVQGYLGPYRVLLADQVIVTMVESPSTTPEQVDGVLGAIGSISRRLPVLRTVFRPYPLGDVSGDRVFFATTAQPAVSASLAASLETQFSCEVVATSNHLADRERLRQDLAAAPAFAVLLVELKAAAVDVAVRTAWETGARVVFCDNRPEVPDGSATDLTAVTERLARLAEARFDDRAQH